MPPTALSPGFLKDYAETYRFSAGTPKAVTIVPGGKEALFLRSGPRSAVQDLFSLDCTSGRERVLLTAEQVLGAGPENLTAEELARRERMRMSSRGITSFSMSEDGTKLLVPLAGRLFVIDRASAHSRELPSKGGFPIDPTFSPDASLVGAVRDGELWVTNIASGAEHQVTRGAGGTISNATAEFAAQEEMGRFHGYWWSPDASHVIYQQTDVAGMQVFHIMDPLHPERDPQSWPYPRTGTTNAAVRLAIVPVAGGEPVWVRWDAKQFPYVATVTWAKNSPPTVLVQDRAQQHEVLLEIDPATGETIPLLEEHDDAWINLFQSCPKWLEDGSGFLWLSEREGETRLELHDRHGNLRSVLTPRSFGLADLLSVDHAGGFAYVSASDEPTETHVWRVPLRGGDPEQITHGQGVHAVSFARDFSAAYESASMFDGTIIQRIGPIGTPAGVVVRTVGIEPPFIPKIEINRVTDRQFRAVVVRPRNFHPGRKYPVLVGVYAGPHSNTVNASARGYLFQQWMADHGFIVVSIDGRGTPRRGRGWERAIRDDLARVPLDDQVAGLVALGREHPEMDMSRVGIYGWSFGGYFSAMAAMRRPDVYRAAFAGAPVADWRDYDTHYTERYMGLPDANKDGYDRASVLTYCRELRVPLLIAQGTADDNVYFLHSLRMADALTRAGRPFEFMPLPGFTHMVAEPEMVERLWNRVAGFFERELIGR